MSDDLISIAQRWLGVGFSVIPVQRNKRACQEWGPFQLRPYEANEVEQAFNDPRAHGLAIVCGYGGLFCFDFDADKKGIAAKPFDLEQEFHKPWRD